MLTLATHRRHVQVQAGCTIHMPLTALQRAVSISYAHKNVHHAAAALTNAAATLAQAWDDQTHHVVRLPAGCVKWVRHTHTLEGVRGRGGVCVCVGVGVCVCV